MARGVTKQPTSGIALGLRAAAKAAAGDIAGREKVQAKTQFDETLAENTRQFDENLEQNRVQFNIKTAQQESQFGRELGEKTRQFDANETWRRFHLKSLIDDKVLDRSSTEKIAAEHEDAETGRNKYREDAATGRNTYSEGQQTFRTGEQISAQRERDATSRAALEGDELANATWGSDVVDRFGKDWGTFSDSERLTALLEYARRKGIDPGQITGDQSFGAAQELTDAEVRALSDELDALMTDVTTTRSGLRDQRLKDVRSGEAAQAAGKAEGQEEVDAASQGRRVGELKEVTGIQTDAALQVEGVRGLSRGGYSRPASARTRSSDGRVLGRSLPSATQLFDELDPVTSTARISDKNITEYLGTNNIQYIRAADLLVKREANQAAGPFIMSAQAGHQIGSPSEMHSVMYDDFTDRLRTAATSAVANINADEDTKELLVDMYVANGEKQMSNNFIAGYAQQLGWDESQLRQVNYNLDTIRQVEEIKSGNNGQGTEQALKQFADEKNR